MSELNTAQINHLSKRFPDFEEKYDKRKKTFTRDGITLNLKLMTLSFKKNTRITDIIETVILLSEYAKNLTKNPDEMLNKEPGNILGLESEPNVFNCKMPFLN